MLCCLRGVHRSVVELELLDAKWREVLARVILPPSSSGERRDGVANRSELSAHSADLLSVDEEALRLSVVGADDVIPAVVLDARARGDPSERAGIVL
jgi:hypothetical protein